MANGLQITVGIDSGLPRSENSHLIYTPNAIKVSLVASIMSKRGRWNEDKIRLIFLLEDVDTIIIIWGYKV